MKDKMRGFLGFLGLIEDDYGDYGAQVPARPFTDQVDNVAEPEWAPPVSPRPGAATAHSTSAHSSARAILLVCSAPR